MTRFRIAVPVLAALALLAPNADAQSLAANPASPRGSEVRVAVRAGARSVTVKGELLAIDSAQVWIVVKDRITTIPRDSVTRIRLRVHRFGGARAAIVGAVGGFLTGLGMVVACSSLEETSDCGGVFVAWQIPWVVLTAISAMFMQSNSWEALPVDGWWRVAAYARYPQGAPPTLIAEPLVFPQR